MSAGLVTRYTSIENLPEMLSVEECAKWLGLGRGKTYELVRCNEIPAVRFGKLIRVPRSALAEIARREQAVAS